MKDKIRKIKDIVLFLNAEPAFIHTLMKIASSDNNTMLLLGTPVHGNLGDHLIADSEKQFLSTYFPDYTCIECSMQFSKRFLSFIKAHIKCNTPVLISGGGWLGTEWKHNEEYVRRIVTEFENNPILIFPQTVFYTNDNAYIREGERIYSKCKSLEFCVRDRRSFDFLCENNFATKNRLHLFPDMGLLYKNSITNKRNKKNVVGICFRDDIEVSIDSSLTDRIINFLSQSNYSIKRIYTNKKRKTIRINKRNTEITSLLTEISSIDLLITDRLHAMVMAAITNTPCIAFDNSTHKVSGVYQWINELDYVYLADHDDNIFEVITRMLNTEFSDHFDIKRFDGNLKALADIISGMESGTHE